jgi:hypothetical protein
MCAPEKIIAADQHLPRRMIHENSFYEKSQLSQRFRKRWLRQQLAMFHRTFRADRVNETSLLRKEFSQPRFISLEKALYEKGTRDTCRASIS